MPYLSALEVCPRRGAIQIHVYLPLPYLLVLDHASLKSLVYRFPPRFTFTALLKSDSESESDPVKNRLVDVVAIPRQRTYHYLKGSLIVIVINRFYMKLFSTKSIETVKYCQEYFDFSLPSVLWASAYLNLK